MNKDRLRLRGRWWIGAVGIASVAMMTTSGCGPRSDRLQVSGAVTLDGAPLDGGTIRFTSVGAEKVTASGAMIRQGHYMVPQEHGLRPGTYHLEISAPDADAPKIIVRDTPGGPGIPTAPERIPPEYNSDSKKTIEVTADGDNVFDFEISGKPKK